MGLGGVPPVFADEVLEEERAIERDRRAHHERPREREPQRGRGREPDRERSA
jgi:hypothetical protein